MTLDKVGWKVAVPILVAALGLGAGGTAVLAGQEASGSRGANDALTEAAAQGEQSGGEQSEFHQREMTAGAKTFKRVQTSNGAITTASTTPQALTVGSVPVGPGRTALINVKWAGETACFAGGFESNWCYMRVLIGNAEGHPQTGIDFAIDSTESGTARSTDWEGHVIERHRCVRNASTSTVNVPVVVQWGVTNFGGGSAPVFRVDDWSLDMERADNCSPLN